MPAAPDPRRGAPRALRGAALAVASALLAVTAHVAGGGAAPDGALTGLLTLAVAAGGTALADRQRGPVALLAAVGGVQVLAHLLLDGPGGHRHSVPAAVPVADPLAMTAAHALAAALTALLLAGAESAVFAVAAAWGRIAAAAPARLTPPLPPARPAVLPVAAAPVPTALRVLLQRLLRRRGPPLPS